MHNNLQDKKTKDQSGYVERAPKLEECALEKRERALGESARALEESATRERKKR